MKQLQVGKSYIGKIKFHLSSAIFIKMDSDLIVTEFTDSNNRNMKNKLVKKRDDYLQWSDYFMSIAFLSAMRSKDPNSQVGACIVNPEKKIVGIGYNGMPNRCNDDELPWGREGPFLETKYAYVCHAEMNAIMNKNTADVKNCTIYVALFPCNECAKLIIQSGIKEVVYLSDKYHKEPSAVAARKLFDMAGVTYRQHIPAKMKIEINFEEFAKSPPKPSNK
ncbi:deoxycytidylate deaminase-like isoform X1 [Centruroides sculpturatus]|uniref:deoxycytidylate deaminase-like isoform X1 n=2 Tax=Centruroides sculpturatus TaxID=218467 RepID=UPI000C6E0DD0|nr:deoxycytidylate deaminase-like isoform X1 [Centruroides sculpturatus]XP_023210765.1 deoxycytidylate deaminase-like isoform X1 [Centruroides sculpturatus]